MVNALHGRTPASRSGAWRPLIRAACLALAALLLCAAPALAQQQIDPSVPTNIPPENQNDFKGYLDQVMDDIMATNGPVILNAGNTLWRGLAAIVVVWTGVKIAMSGTFSMWAIVQLVIGLWIPWVMLQFYATPIPGVGFTFPGMIAGGGNWLHSFFLADIVPAMQIELSNLVHTQTTAVSDAWAGTILAGAVHGPRGCRRHAHHRHVDDALHFSVSGRHLRRDLRPSDLGAHGDADPHVRRADDDSVARVRADGVSVLGLVPQHDHLRALRRDGRRDHARLHERVPRVHHHLFTGLRH